MHQLDTRVREVHVRQGHMASGKTYEVVVVEVCHDFCFLEKPFNQSIVFELLHRNLCSAIVIT